MLKVTSLEFEDLTDEEKQNAPNNGSGKEYAGYLRVTYKGETLLLASDAMEPEDARFYRDLSWIEVMIEKAYQLGKKESKN